MILPVAPSRPKRGQMLAAQYFYLNTLELGKLNLNLKEANREDEPRRSQTLSYTSSNPDTIMQGEFTIESPLRRQTRLSTNVSPRKLNESPNGQRTSALSVKEQRQSDTSSRYQTS